MDTILGHIATDRLILTSALGYSDAGIVSRAVDIFADFFAAFADRFKSDGFWVFAL